MSFTAPVEYGIGDFDPPDLPEEDGEELPERSAANGYAPAFVIDSEEKACWLLRKLANLEAEQARIKAQAEEMISALQSDRNRLLFLFGGQLETWAREELAKRGGHRKSLPTLQGTLSFRTVPQTVRIADAQAAMAYARENAPAVVQTTEKLDTAAYKLEAEQALETTGEVLPGVEVCPEREAFSIKFAKE